MTALRRLEPPAGWDAATEEDFALCSELGKTSAWMPQRPSDIWGSETWQAAVSRNVGADLDPDREIQIAGHAADDGGCDSLWPRR